MTHWFKAGSVALLGLLLPVSTLAADKAVAKKICSVQSEARH